MTEHEKTANDYREQRSRILHGLADRARLRSPLGSPLSHLIWSDLPAYESPIDGRIIAGRAQRREDLKRNGCREYDPGMKQDAKRNNQENNAQLDRIIGESVERMYNQLSDTKRKQLDREMGA